MGDGAAAPRRQPGVAAGDYHRPLEPVVPSGEKARIRANLAAIERLRELGDDPATSDDHQVLAQWSSWGAVPQVFDHTNTSYDTVRAKLRRLFDTHEHSAAQRTVLNAHFTDPVVVDQMWQLLDDLGLPDQARVLEPGCGSGNFIGRAPTGTQVTGVELDPTTAAIAAKLYPSATIRAESFSDTVGLDGFDATIGNVPFGNIHLYDPAYNRGKHSVHNHFIIKSLALTNPGGLVAVLTSHYTLDATGTAAREEMAQLGELVGAIRLPSGAQQRIAGTQAITDLLVFRRHPQPPVGDARPGWLDTTPIQLGEHELPLNNYFHAHPTHVLGDLSAKHGQYAGELVVTAADTYPADLRRFVAYLGRRGRQAGLTWQPHTPEPVASVGGRPAGFLGHLRRRDGNFEQAVGGGQFEPVTVPDAQAAELGHLLRLRDLYVELLTAEAATTIDTPQICELRGRLNDVYDDYADRYGPINRYTETASKRRDTDGDPIVSRRYPGAVTRFKHDPHAVYVRALEVFDDTTHTARKAAILRGRVLVARQPKTHADSPADALAIVLDQHGHVDPDTVASLLGTTPDQVPDQLGDLVFTEPPDPTRTDHPGTDRLIPAAEYLSGRVREKLQIATLAAQTDDRFTRNVTALRAVIPADLQPGEIRAALGASWIGPDDVQAFLRDILRDPKVTVTHNAADGWKVTGGLTYTVQATEEWGTGRMAAHKIAQYVCNQMPIRITDEQPDGSRLYNPQASAAAREKGAALNAEFGRWVWDDPARADRLATLYNELFNGTVLRRDYRRGPMDLPGLALSWKPGAHQLNAVARAIQEPSTGVFHPVGYGKTAVMVMAMMEQKRLGLVSKPALVVPNHMLEQAEREFLQLYPAARIVAASSDDLTADRRRAFVAKVTNGDWDAVIMTRGAFGALPVSPAETQRYLDEEIRPIREAFQAQRADGNSRTVKRAEKALLELEERIKAKLDRQRDVGVTFEQIGIDYLCIDELHDFKNLTTPSRIPGAGIAAGSKRATDLHQKVSYLRRVHGGRAILGATATPISNSVSEVYVMLRHLRPDLLTSAGITTFDEWAATFGQTVTTIELAAAGQTFRETTRFARFQNVPELLTMWSAAGDALTPAAVDLPRPQLVPRPGDGRRVPQAVQVPASDQLLELTSRLADRAERVKSGGVDPHDDNMLKITSEGRLAALDLRLTPDHPAGQPFGLDVPTKADVAAATIHRIWAEHADRRYLDAATGQPHPRPGALQLVFCDLGTPKNDATYSVYDDLRSQLIDRGVPAGQIAFTHQARNDAEKGRLFERARTGEVQVLIGSTQMMGVGTNVQNRAIALHHLDCPWKPAEMEQREGRIVRQGNQHDEVMIFRYATQKSFDGYMYQTVARKGAFIDQVMSGQVNLREIDDIASSETLSYEEMQAAISGNPHLRERQQVSSEIAQLELLARSHRDAARSLAWRITNLEHQIAQLTAEIPQIEADAARVVDTRGDRFAITLGDRRLTDRADAARLLHGMVTRLDLYRGTPTRIGSLGGLPLDAQRVADAYGSRPYVRIAVSPHLKPVLLTSDDLDNGPSPSQIVRLENAVAGLPSRVVGAKAALDDATDQLQRARSRQGQPFAHHDRLDQLRRRLAEIDHDIANLAHDNPPTERTAAMPEPTTETLVDQIRRAHPQLQVSAHTPDPDELADLGLATGPHEIRIASTGPGHYAIPIPADQAPIDDYELWFVHVNDLPGDGALLGSYPTPLAAAESAAQRHETEQAHAAAGTAAQLHHTPATPAASTSDQPHTHRPPPDHGRSLHR